MVEADKSGRQMALILVLRLNRAVLMSAFAAALVFNVAGLRAENSAHALGEHSVLFLRMEFADDPAPPVSAETAQEMLARADKEFRTYSYGVFWLSYRIRHIYLPNPRSFYDRTSIYAAAKEAARSAGEDPDNYQTTAYYSTFFGRAHAFSKEIFVSNTNVSEVVHETGHNLRLPHAESAAFATNDFLGEETIEPYGNIYDLMGGAPHYLQPENPAKLPTAHFNAFLKHRLGWLPEENVARVQTNGIYSLAPIDNGPLNRASHHAIRIPRTSTKDFWIELRTGAPACFNGNGVLIMLCSSTADSLENLLIDTTPGSEPVWKYNGRGGDHSGKWDAALTTGRSLLDPKSGIFIAPLGWKDNRFEVFVRLSGNDLPPPPYYDGYFTWVQPELFPAGFPPELIFGYNGYFSAVPGKQFTIEDSADLKTWNHITNFLSDGSVVHFNRELSTFAPRFFRAFQSP